MIYSDSKRVYCRSIAAKGTKLSREEVEAGVMLDRVNVIIAYIDLPDTSPIHIYCRRERIENATVEVEKIEGEVAISDVYHLKIFNVKRECTTVLFLPLYQAVSDKEEMVLRFIDCDFDDMVIDEYLTDKKVQLDHCF